MESTYKLPFQEAISRGGAAGVMYACNKVNGIPSVVNNSYTRSLKASDLTDIGPPTETVSTL